MCSDLLKHAQTYTRVVINVQVLNDVQLCMRQLTPAISNVFPIFSDSFVREWIMLSHYIAKRIKE